jgi:hypothetical protein
MELKMNTKILISAGILIFFLFSVSLAKDEKIPISADDAIELLSGLWFTEVGAKEDRFVYNKEGTFSFYFLNDELPAFTGEFRIEKAWKDREDNTWVILWLSFRGGIRALTKINKDGNIRESVRRYARNELPTTIDPNDDKYARFNRERKN